MHKRAWAGMELFRDDYLPPGKYRVLDVGSCDVDPDANLNHRQLFDLPGWEYIGCDITPGFNVDIVLKAPYDWKEFSDEEFDVVISSQAFEHIEFPWLTIREMARVLKKGGWVCIIAPTQISYHPFPVDCYRYYPDGLRALAKWANLEVIDAMCNNEYDGFVQDCILIARK